MPIRGPSGQALPACAAPSGWIASWVREGDGRPAAWIREKAQKVDAGTLRTREAYGFAGFSLDFDAARSSTDVAGVPIPSWYPATLYSRKALETLYSRFRLAEMRGEPTLRIETDRARGVFALRFTGPDGDAGRAGRRLRGRRRKRDAGRARRGAHGAGCDPPQRRRIDPLRGPRRGPGPAVGPRLLARRRVARRRPAGLPRAPRTSSLRRISSASGRIRPGERRRSPSRASPPTGFASERSATRSTSTARPLPFDALLCRWTRGGRPWGIVLKGQNALERMPLACSGKPPRPPCRADGAPETLRRTRRSDQRPLGPLGRPERPVAKPANLRLDKDLRWNSRP